MKSRFEQLCERAVAVGLILKRSGGDYHLLGTNTSFKTDDLDDALAYIEGYKPATAEKPLGPMGSARSSLHRAKMYRHNRKIAARRAKRRGS